MSELKTCPFCGKEVDISRRTNSITGKGYLSINCCSPMIVEFVPRGYKPKKKDSEEACREVLVKRWNTRKPTIQNATDYIQIPRSIWNLLFKPNKNERYGDKEWELICDFSESIDKLKELSK